MKIKIVLALVALCAAVPVASPKGPAVKTSFGAVCDGYDICTVTGSGFAANTTYSLEAADSCGALAYRSNVNTSGSGAINAAVPLSESATCVTTGWTFNLYSGGKRPALVATAIASDPD